ncbi:MAG: alpha/beta hydrolase [Proteobacteria bacterium]|nr:alpha/beta hydrolase [Burkholderiales bacterium]
MPHATTADGVKLYFEEAGAGTPIVFVHEFGDNYTSWEAQIRHFSRRHRCIVFSARGYPPSDVPDTLAHYSQRLACDDIAAVMDHLGIASAHIVGLSMGGLATLHFGLNHAARARSLVAAGAGYGAEKAFEAEFRRLAEVAAGKFETMGPADFAEIYGEAASRVQFQNKDPRGWRAFVDRLKQHSQIGAANTMRGVQARRPSLYDLEAGFRAMQIPTLLIVGDEDDHCLQPGIFLKRAIPACGLVVLPKTGHAVNLEEPALFNQFVAEFLAQVEAGRWSPRDPRADPGQVIKT